MSNRTGVDFSKHDLNIIKSTTYSIYDLKHPEHVMMWRVKFINIDGVLVVTGDYGNWIFCREFHPTSDGFVSDYYWCEKLQINSEQKPYEFDSENTEKELKEGIEKGLKDYGYEGERLEKMKEYYQDCLNYVYNSEFEYTSFAYNNMLSWMDSEDVPFVKSIKIHLKYVFDAFDEICIRMKNKKEKIKTEESISE